jgi:hypothetical protein
VDILFIIALFCVFVITAFSVVNIGAQIYQSTINDMGENYTSRTALAYVSEKIRHSDGDCIFQLVDIDGTKALSMQQADEKYKTYIYFYQGQLWEAYVKEDHIMSLGDGEAIIEVADFEILQDEQRNIYRIRVKDSTGIYREVLVHLRGRQ